MSTKEIFSQELIKAVEARKKKSQDIMYIPKKENPLKVIPKPRKRLYGISDTSSSKGIFFQTEEELKNFLENTCNELPGMSSQVCAVEYLGNVASRDDVIRIIFLNGKSYLVRIKEDTSWHNNVYEVYNENESIKEGTFIWDTKLGDLRLYYKAFLDAGIDFKDIVIENMSSEKKLIKK